MTTCHVIGAGLAGLAAALRLAESGRRVALYEQAPQAGGRCRSFYDATLDRLIDNGSHMALSGNHALVDYARRSGAGDALTALRPAAFPFLDQRDGALWTLRPGGLWLFDEARRVPGSRPWQYLAALRAVVAGSGRTMDQALPPDGPLHERLWRPLAVSALNGPTARVSARLFGAVMRDTLLRGEAACRPLVTPHGLTAAFVDPALRRLVALGADLRLGARVDALRFDDERSGGRVVALSVEGATVNLPPGESVILAAPAWVAERLIPGLTAPPPGPAIVNVHYRLDASARLPGGLPFLGLIGGQAEWLFAREDVVAVTVSDADALVDQPAEAIAALLWRDVAAALRLDGPIRPYRVVKERRATPDQAPDSVLRRSPARTRWGNLTLAGDWTDTGLPASLEAAVRSGDRAAKLILSAR
jgi:hydroxysqualene dehydroxylase